MKVEPKPIVFVRYYHAKWKRALLSKEFTRAGIYFRLANHWKVRADIKGMLGERLATKVKTEAK